MVGGAVGVVLVEGDRDVFGSVAEVPYHICHLAGGLEAHVDVVSVEGELPVIGFRIRDWGAAGGEDHGGHREQGQGAQGGLGSDDPHGIASRFARIDVCVDPVGRRLSLEGKDGEDLGVDAGRSGLPCGGGHGDGDSGRSDTGIGDAQLLVVG